MELNDELIVCVCPWRSEHQTIPRGRPGTRGVQGRAKCAITAAYAVRATNNRRWTYGDRVHRMTNSMLAASRTHANRLSVFCPNPLPHQLPNSTRPVCKILRLLLGQTNAAATSAAAAAATIIAAIATAANNTARGTGGRRRREQRFLEPSRGGGLLFLHGGVGVKGE